MQQFADRFGVTKPPEESGFSAERLGRIAEFFDRQTELGVIPGWSALVARDGEPVYAAGGGLRDLELGLPVEPTTLWRLYSMTKPVTSVAAMMLVERVCSDSTTRSARTSPSSRTWRCTTAGRRGAYGSARQLTR